MGQLYQMQVSFDPLEDRLRFRLNTRSRTEFRFLLTRRYVRLLWQALWEMLKTRRQVKKSDSSPVPPSPLPPEVAAAQSFEISLEHREAVKQGDFATPFHEGSSLPLGPGFILLSKVAVKNSPSGPQVLSIGPESGEGVDLTLDDRMLHSLCRLLADAAAKADWGIDLDFSAELRKLSGPPLN